jgi:DNA-binding SARP family transcriptional activator/DNA-binding beta-propeller fold protein YncE
VDFRVLGPLEVSAAGQPVALGGRKQRTVLALLLLNANELVPRERMIAALWGDEPPSEADASLRVYIARLRKLLAAETNGRPVLDTSANGYVLRVEPESVDLERFRRLVAAGEFERALELWRGPALADLAEEEWARREGGVLDELRLSALEERIDAGLAARRDSELVPELEALVAEHPYRERLVGQLMLALYRSGRQPEALGAYKRVGTDLRETFGLEPTPWLRELERKILVQDPSLEPRAAPARRTRGLVRRHRRGSMLAAVTTVGLLALVAAFLARPWERATSSGEPLMGNSIVAIDRVANEVLGEVPLGGRPSALAAGEGSVWAGNADEKTLLRVDPSTRRIVSTIGLGNVPTGVTVGGGSVWVVSQEANLVFEIDPASDDVVATIRLPERETLCCPHQIAFARGAVWVAYWSSLVRIDPRTHEVVSSPFPDVDWIASTGDALWAIVGVEADGVRRLDPPGEVIALRALGPVLGLRWITAGPRDVWAASYGGTLSRIDPEVGRVTATVFVGRQIAGVVPGRRALWVATGAGDVLRIDPTTGRIAKKLPLGVYAPHQSNTMAIAGGSVWILALER